MAWQWRAAKAIMPHDGPKNPALRLHIAACAPAIKDLVRRLGIQGAAEALGMTRSALDKVRYGEVCPSHEATEALARLGYAVPSHPSSEAAEKRLGEADKAYVGDPEDNARESLRTIERGWKAEGREDLLPPGGIRWPRGMRETPTLASVGRRDGRA